MTQDEENNDVAMWLYHVDTSSITAAMVHPDREPEKKRLFAETRRTLRYFWRGLVELWEWRNYA